MKTTVKQLSDNTYVITFGIFESAAALKVSCCTMQSFFSRLRSQYSATDMYGRFVNRATREQYDRQDYYDLAANPDYVIRAGGLRLDSEEVIVSVKLEVIRPEAIGSTASEIELGFNSWGWVFVPRCYVLENEDEIGVTQDHATRAYVGLPSEMPKDWIRDSNIVYRTIDIWFIDDVNTVNGSDEIEDPAPIEEEQKSTKIVVDKTQAELIKAMLSTGFDFTMTIGDTQVEFQVTGRVEEERIQTDWVESLSKHFEGKNPHLLPPGYNGATFTPEQHKPGSTDPTRSMWGPE